MMTRNVAQQQYGPGPFREELDGSQVLANKAATGVPFFTAEQNPPAGTASSHNKSTPKLFTPIKIRDVELQNRIWVSPMCQYGANEGFATPWHVVQYGGLAQRGPGLVMVEATAVQANGRISPECLGIWQDAHIDGLRKIVEFSHSQNSLIAIQLGHAGRKASGVAPWISPADIATEEVGGWPDDTIGPNDEPYTQDHPKPRAMSLKEIQVFKRDFVSAAKRAIYAGFDVIELHFAHGFLISSFFSPKNKRTDQYGGSFENRTRLAIEVIDDLRAVMPKGMPLFVRISATDWLDADPDFKGESWTIKDSISLANLFAKHGVDVLDISSGGMDSSQKIKKAAGSSTYQTDLAKQIKKAVGDKILVSAVGSITTGNIAEDILVGGKDSEDTAVDLVAAGRTFLKNPGLVWAWADDLDIDIQHAHQFSWAFSGRGEKKSVFEKMSDA